MQPVLIPTEITRVPVMMATLVMAIVAKVCVFLLAHGIFYIFDFDIMLGQMVAPIVGVGDMKHLRNVSKLDLGIFLKSSFVIQKIPKTDFESEKD